LIGWAAIWRDGAFSGTPNAATGTVALLIFFAWRIIVKGGQAMEVVRVADITISQ
jgi:hypothetical protein